MSPITLNRKENTHNPLLLIIEKEKKFKSHIPKEKNQGPLGCRLHLLIG
jgi:hypothetical protein